MWPFWKNRRGVKVGVRRSRISLRVADKKAAGRSLRAAIALASISGLAVSPPSEGSTRAASSQVEGVALTVPRKIPADCSAGARRALQRWLRTVPNGSAIRFPSGSCYLLNRALVIKRRTSLTLRGAGATLKSGTPRPSCYGKHPIQHVLSIMNSHDIRVLGLRIVGTNASPGKFTALHYCQNGVNVGGSTDVLLRNIMVRRPWGDCVYGGVAYVKGAWVGTKNLTVVGMNCSGAGREGASPVRVNHFAMYGSTIRNVGRNGVSADANTPHDHSPWISVVGNAFHGPKAFTVNVTDTRSDHVRIVDNTCSVRACAFHIKGDVNAYTDDVVISGNVSKVGLQSFASALLQNVSNVGITSNMLPCPSFPNGGRLFLKVGNAAVVTATNNKISRCREYKTIKGTTQTGIVLLNNRT
jgi:hypothetical protein